MSRHTPRIALLLSFLLVLGIALGSGAARPVRAVTEETIASPSPLEVRQLTLTYTAQSYVRRSSDRALILDLAKLLSLASPVEAEDLPFLPPQQPPVATIGMLDDAARGPYYDVYVSDARSDTAWLVDPDGQSWRVNYGISSIVRRIAHYDALRQQLPRAHEVLSVSLASSARTQSVGISQRGTIVRIMAALRGEPNALRYRIDEPLLRQTHGELASLFLVTGEQHVSPHRFTLYVSHATPSTYYVADSFGETWPIDASLGRLLERAIRVPHTEVPRNSRDGDPPPTPTTRADRDY